MSQVILVGHSCGGASISYALEHFSKKITKAVFLSATMVQDGQRPFDVFSGEVSAPVHLLAVASKPQSSLPSSSKENCVMTQQY